jgi:hypothetical protein
LFRGIRRCACSLRPACLWLVLGGLLIRFRFVGSSTRTASTSGTSWTRRATPPTSAAAAGASPNSSGRTGEPALHVPLPEFHSPLCLVTESWHSSLCVHFVGRCTTAGRWRVTATSSTSRAASRTW